MGENPSAADNQQGRLIMSKEIPFEEVEGAIKKAFSDISNTERRLGIFINHDLGHERKGVLRVAMELEERFGMKFDIEEMDRNNPLREPLLSPSETTSHEP